VNNYINARQIRFQSSSFKSSSRLTLPLPWQTH